VDEVKVAVDGVFPYGDVGGLNETVRPVVGLTVADKPTGA
jgi:hypothetical protein